MHQSSEEHHGERTSSSNPERRLHHTRRMYGEVHQLQQRVETFYADRATRRVIVLTFVVITRSDQGQREIIIPVTMQGMTIHGVLRNGDTVIIATGGRIRTRVRLRYIRNVTRHLWVRVAWSRTLIVGSCIATALLWSGVLAAMVIGNDMSKLIGEGIVVASVATLMTIAFFIT